MQLNGNELGNGQLNVSKITNSNNNFSNGRSQIVANSDGLYATDRNQRERHHMHPRSASPSSKFVLVRTVEECRKAVNALSAHPRIALDCEGVALSRTGRLCLLQAKGLDTVYIFDLVNSPTNTTGANLYASDQDKRQIVRAQLSHARRMFEKGGLKKLLEDKSVTKIMHDCRHDSDALYHQFGIKLGPVIDTQVVFFVLRRCTGLEDGLPVSLKTLLKKFSFVSDNELEVKNSVKESMKGDSDFWLQRPLSETALWYARLDVEHLLPLLNLLSKLIQQSSKEAWNDAVHESQRYLTVFRDDFDGPRKAQVEYEMQSKIAKRQRTAAKMSRKVMAHRRNDPLRSFKFDQSRIVDALNG